MDDTPQPARAAQTDAAPRKLSKRDQPLTSWEARRLRWLTTLGALLLRALARTWRMTLIDRVSVDALRAAGKPVVIVFWHGEMLPMLWAHRDEGVSILISSHRDGEIIAQVGERFGCRTVRGSSSRGAARALLGLVRELEAGHDVAVTPDGPRGPRGYFAPGALVAAQRTGAHVAPIAAHASSAWRLRSWDAFMIPKPFARVTVAYAPPTQVMAASGRDAAGDVARFELLLADAARRAGA